MKKVERRDGKRRGKGWEKEEKGMENGREKGWKKERKRDGKRREKGYYGSVPRQNPWRSESQGFPDSPSLLGFGVAESGAVTHP